MGCLNNEYPLLRVIRVEGREARKKQGVLEQCSEPWNRLSWSGKAEGGFLGMGWGVGAGGQGKEERQAGQPHLTPRNLRVPAFLQHLPPMLTLPHLFTVL